MTALESKESSFSLDQVAVFNTLQTGLLANIFVILYCLFANYVVMVTWGTISEIYFCEVICVGILEV